MVERYHALVRASYFRIRMDMDRETTDAECLRMVVFYVNYTMDPEGLCPILLVFSVIPKPARTSPSITQVQRLKAIESGIIEDEKEQKRRRIELGFRTAGGPISIETSSKLRHLPAGEKVFVYRNKSKEWEGPQKFISIEGETVVIQKTT